jgi:two-component system torCAD operon response regulator TorR
MRLLELAAEIAPELAPKLARVLLVEDDDISREITAAHLRKSGFAVSESSNASEALAHVRSDRGLQLYIVDVGLPDQIGFDLVEALRGELDRPVIFLTSHGKPVDRIRGLDSGGDDYVVKPVDLGELSARVRAVLRRYRAPAPSTRMPVLELGGWTLDLVRRELADQLGTDVGLTRGEFDLFAALVQAQGKVLSRDYLTEVVARTDGESSPRTIDVMVSRIRRKIASGAAPIPHILTARGQGYRFGSARSA